MNDKDGISWEELNRLFSVVLCLDESMAIIHASETPLKYMPDLQARPALADAFDVRRPNALSSYADAIAGLQSLCLLTAKNRRFAVRGQLVRARYNDQPVICFCGSPWLFWINTHCPDIRLGLTDYSMQDVQLDQLFFMNTEKQMVQDLEKLNDELQAAKVAVEKAQESQRRFFAQMSHEMRTPLNGIVSALSLLDGEPAEALRLKLLPLAKSSSENLMEVINYVLDVSKLEFTGIDEGAKVFNLSSLLHKVENVVHARAVEKSLEMRLNLEIHPAWNFSGQPQLLQQALLNLLINAIKFTDSGSITLNCRPVAIKDGRHTLRFEVVDTGSGIAADDRERIFEPFWSGHADTDKGIEKGTGLGLDIVRRNIEHMGGKVGLESTVGSGSTFWFQLCLPLVRTEDIPDSTIDNIEPDATTIGGRVLLVDDNDTNLLLGSMILESLGVEVVTASGGAEAIAVARVGGLDMVLMDLTMPEVDGLEATRKIREFADDTVLPIVALTAHADTLEKQACLAAGMNAYLTKPIVREALANALRRWIPETATATPPPSDPATAHTVNAAEPHARLLHLSVLEELEQQIGRGNLATVVDKVLTEADQRWDELVAAESAGDRATVQRHVHSLASIFRSVGLLEAGDALAAIEISLRAGEELAGDWLATQERLKSTSLRALGEALQAR